MQGPSAPARVLADRYELLVRLGAGGAGTVWRGYDRALDRPVAVKLLHADLADDPAAESRFRTEATAAAKLTHPNAVLVYDVGRDEHDDYLVMELVEGPSLADLLVDGPVPAGIGAAVGAMVAGALGAAHAAEIVHRDVKPGNVLLAHEGAAKLADFGIARALGAISARLTRTGMVLGTARYLAPEQLRDDPIDGRADVYALGLVLHEALTGLPPFGEGNAVEIAARRLNTTLPPVGDVVADVPAGLDEVIRWATRLDPRERPDDGRAMATALRAFASHDASTAIARLVSDHEPSRPATDDGTAGSRPSRSPSVPPPARTGAPAAGTSARPSSTRALPAAAGVAASAGPTTPPVPSGDAPGRTSVMGAATGSPGSERASRPSTASRWVLAAVATVAIVAAVLLTGGDRDGGSTPPADPGEALPTADTGDHDPSGDGRERPDDVGNAVDGDLDTFWPTETYNSADLGGLKDGVGLWIQLEETTALSHVEVTLSRDGGELELWVGDGPPDGDQQPDDWGTLAGEGAVEADDVRFPDLPPGTDGDTILLWFTELPPGGSDFRAEVRDVRVYGR